MMVLSLPIYLTKRLASSLHFNLVSMLISLI